MSEYATLKRRPILFPDSVSSFHDSIFSLKEELKALVADDLQNKDAYVQTAVEIAIDLRSALADWTLTKLVDDDTRWPPPRTCWPLPRALAAARPSRLPARRSNPSPTAPCARWATCTARAS